MYIEGWSFLSTQCTIRVLKIRAATLGKTNENSTIVDMAAQCCTI